MARKIRNKPAIAISGVRKMHRDASLIIIACEGEKTEAQYLSFSCFQNSRVKLCPVPSKEGKSAPVYVLENLKEKAEEYDLKPGDQLWIVIDGTKASHTTFLAVCQGGDRGLQDQGASSLFWFSI